MERLRGLIGRLRREPGLRQQLLLYVAIGGFVQIVDLSVYFTMLHYRAWAEAALTVAGGIAMVTHFCLNKYVNFRNHDRPVAQQAGTYLTVGVVWWVITISIVSTMTRGFGISPAIAKFTAIAVNFPLGYLSHRYLTFGQGIRGTYRSWRARRAGEASPSEDSLSSENGLQEASAPTPIDGETHALI